MTVDQVSPPVLDEMFGLLANESRIEILHEVWKTYPEPLSFSELQSRVSIDDSGTFNYHLDLLVPEFLQGTDGRYTLTYAGRQAIGAAVSGRFTEADDLDVGPIPAGECMFCHAEAVARYEDGAVTVDCSECDNLITRMPVPPITVASADTETLTHVFSRHILTRTHQLSRGFCTLCNGRVDSSLTALSSEESATFRSTLDVRFECRECGVRTSLNIGAVVMDHPAVISFLFDAGIDLRETHVWEVVPVLDPDATVVSENPLRLKIEIAIESERLELVIDESATVRSYDQR